MVCTKRHSKSKSKNITKVFESEKNYGQQEERKHLDGDFSKRL